MFRPLAHVMNERNDEQSRSYHRSPARDRARNATRKIADAYDVEADRAGCCARDHNGSVQVFVRKHMPIYYQILTQHRKGRKTAKRGDRRFQQQEIKQKRIHSFSPATGQRPPTTAATKSIRIGGIEKRTQAAHDPPTNTSNFTHDAPRQCGRMIVTPVMTMTPTAAASAPRSATCAIAFRLHNS